MLNSSIAGGIGAFIATPADKSLVRLQNDNIAPPELKKNYKHVFDCVKRIVQEEGFIGLYKGALPTTIRAMVMNGVMLTSNDQIRENMAAAG